MEKDPKPLPGAIPPKTSAKPPAANAATAQATEEHPAANNPENCAPPPPPFDMLDIPEGMERMGFHYAAYCARRWFNGEAHKAPLDQNASFDNRFVDSDSLKLKWLLEFGKVRDRYEHLLKNNLAADAAENIFNQKARKSLINIFQKFMLRRHHLFAGRLDALAICKSDVQLLHQYFQFQRINISIPDVLGRPTMIMNDLAASLGNFSLFAAVANAEISNARYNRYDTDPWRQCTHTKVSITHIYVYAKDSYSFNDEDAEKISQYLGHWNRRGVILAVDAVTAELFSKVAAKRYHYEKGNEPRLYLKPAPPDLDRAIDSGHRLSEAEVFYPLRNQHFQSWRDLKGRGGDFLIYSNLKLIKLDRSIELHLGEVCTP